MIRILEAVIADPGCGESSGPLVAECLHLLPTDQVERKGEEPRYRAYEVSGLPGSRPLSPPV